MDNFSVKKIISPNNASKRSASGEILTREIRTIKIILNDDCMIDIIKYLTWNDFFNLCEANICLERYAKHMKGATLYMDEHTRPNQVYINSGPFIKSVQVQFPLPSNTLTTLTRLIESLSNLESLKIREISGNPFPINNNGILNLTIECAPRVDLWDNTDHALPILQHCTKIKTLTFVNGYLKKESIELLSNRPITEIRFVDTHVANHPHFANFLKSTNIMGNLTILGEESYLIQYSILTSTIAFREKLTNLTLQLVDNLASEQYNEIIKFANLENVRVYYRDHYQMKHFYASLLELSTKGKLRTITICDNFYALNPLNMAKLKHADKQIFDTFRDKFAQKSIVLKRRPYIFRI